MKRCEVSDCRMRCKFDGFGHLFCWEHYSEWLQSFLASTNDNGYNHAQLNLDFERK